MKDIAEQEVIDIPDMDVEAFNDFATEQGWSDGMPLAKGKGVFFNDLLEIDWEHVSPVNNNLDLCVRVRIVPADAES